MKALYRLFFGTTTTIIFAISGFSTHATTLSLAPDADTYIELGDQDNFLANHGADETLELSRFSIFSDFAILIRFDLSAIPQGAIINSASLRLFEGSSPYSPPNDMFDISLVTDMWSEATVSGASAPSFGLTIDSVPASPNPIFDVTSAVDAWVNDGVSNYGLYLDNTGVNNFGNFISREGVGSVPSLDIDYTVVPIPAALPLLLSAIGFVLFGARGRRS